MSLRLEPARYLACIDADSARLASVAENGDPEAPVPACPGWTLADAVRHTGAVFWNKVMCMRLCRAPVQGDWPVGPKPGQDLVAWFRDAHQALRQELTSRAATDPTYTWWEPEQTVAFWYRRMAHEVAIHRADVESGCGAVTPIEADLAADGVDEVLRIFAMDLEPHDPHPPGATGQRVALEAGGHRWVVTVGPVAFAVADDGDPDAAVSGEPSDLDLWLWNRPPLGEINVAGDEGAVQALRAWLTICTE